MDRFQYVLVGGGVASVSAAQFIRDRDTEGSMAIVCGEGHPCYDRPPLSKKYLTRDDFVPDDAYSKFDSFYTDNHIDLRTGVRVESIDRGAKTLTLADGNQIGYEKLLLATGTTPRPMDVPGGSNALLLRRIEDAEAIREAMRNGGSLLIIGAGYIGMEVASSALQRGMDVTILELGDRPWPRFASLILGDFMRDAYEAAGVRFVFGDEVVGLSATEATTKNGLSIPFRLAVAGVGVTPNVELAQNAGLEMGKPSGVLVNSHLVTSDPCIWAAGDIARFEDIAMGRTWRLEHQLTARHQGRAAGANMAGENKPYDQVPYFFSDFLDLHMILRGGGVEADAPQRIIGDAHSGEFVELTGDEDGVLRQGIAISHDEPGLDPISDRLEALIRGKVRLDEASLA